MNDPIKKFVQQNREAFDHLDPAPDMLDRIKKQLDTKKKVRRSGSGLPMMLRWSIAASVLLAIATAIVFFPLKKEAVLPSAQLPAQKISSEDHPAIDTNQNTLLADNHHNTVTPEAVQKKIAIPVQSIPAKPAEESSISELRVIMALLADPISSSARLEGVLKLSDWAPLDKALIDTLENKMTADPNINVRMAALEVLVQHSEDPYVADKIVRNLDTQDDPIMQLSLINTVAHIDSTNASQDDIRAKITALANDPLTIAAVRQEAEVYLFHYY